MLVDLFLMVKNIHSAIEKESLAFVYATDHFRAYSLGRGFTLVTDHNALHWLHSLEPKG